MNIIRYLLSLIGIFVPGIGIGVLMGFFSTESSAAQGAKTIHTFTDETLVEVINIEVYVTDRKGLSVTGLQKEDFELKINGEPTNISNFYHVEGGDSLILAIYIDNDQVGMSDRHRLAKTISKFMRDRVHMGDWIFLANAADSVPEQKILTHDPNEFIDTIGNFLQSGGLGIISHDDGRSGWYPDQHGIRRRANMKTFSEVVDYLGGLPGRKILFYLSNTNPSTADHEDLVESMDIPELRAMSQQEPVRNQGTADPQGGTRVSEKSIHATSSPLKMSTRYKYQDYSNTVFDDGISGISFQDDLAKPRLYYDKMLAKIISNANAGRVTFVTIDVAGIQPPSESDASTRSFPSKRDVVENEELYDLLSVMATQTGGKAILSDNKIDIVLGHVAKIFDNYYSLGFNPPTVAKKDDFHIKVKTPGRNSLQVRYRKTARVKPLTEQISEKMMGHLIFGNAENPLSVEISFGVLSQWDRALRLVPIELSVPLSGIQFLPGPNGREGQISVYVTALDRLGRFAPLVSTEIPLRISTPMKEVHRRQLFVYEIQMLMRLGEHSVAVCVRDDIGGVESFVSEDVHVGKTR